MKREAKVPENAEVFFTLIKPTPNKEGPNSRRSFAFIQDVRYFNGDRKQKRYKFPENDDRLKAINRAYKIADDKNEAFEKCLKLALDLQEKLYREHGLELKRVFNQDNYAILDSFFEWKYGAKKTKDKTAAYNDFRRAVDAVGMIPIQTATKAELQKALVTEDNNKQRRNASRLQMILKFLKRDDIILDRDKKRRSSVRYLNEKEFAQVMKLVKDDNLRTFYELAFHSGCRVGEIFALEERHFRAGVINVENQMIRTDEAIRRRKQELKAKGIAWKNWEPKASDLITLTKNEQKRKVVPFPEFADAFKKWCALDYETKFKLRHSRLAEPLREVCEQKFSSDPQKHCVAHDLRHSFAIRLLQFVNLTYVSMQLGNRIEVCQEFYTGYELHDENITVLKSLMSGKK